MNQNQLLEISRLLAPQIQDFLGGSAIVSFKDKIKDISSIGKPQKGGAIGKENSAFLFIENRAGDVAATEFFRSNLPFSSIELQFVSQLCKGLTVLICGFDDPKHAIHLRTATLTTAFDIAIARFLRADTRHFANVQRVIELAKNLTFQRYEGAPCTSGLIYISKAKKGFLNDISALSYQIVRTPTVRVDSTFFNAPFSYRYVDGVQSAYLLTSPATCMGIVQLDPKCPLSWTDLGTHDRFKQLLSITGAGSFAAFTTPNSEVDVLFPSGGILRWRKGRWILIELERLVSIITEHINNIETARLLCKIITGIATSRHGALILISDDTCEDIGIIRRIDDTEIGKMLRERLLNLNLSEAFRSGVFIAALTSDGMTLIDRSGIVRDSGALVNLSGAKASGGGGRTAAAESASHHGLVIKISEDGPIQLWRFGKLLLQTG